MSALEGPALLCALGAVQVFGLVSAAVARMAEGSRRQSLCQRIFFACLGLVGLATALTVAVASGIWILSAGTLSLMVLMATCDFGSQGRAAAW